MNRWNRTVGTLLATMVLASGVATTTPARAVTVADTEPASPVGVSSPPTPDEDAVSTATIEACHGPNVAGFDDSDFVDLGLSQPVARRAAAVAPDLRRVGQLVSIAGIGPDELAAIVAANPELCASPVVVPPEPTDACVDAAQFDVNDLDSEPERDELANSTVLSPEEVRVLSVEGPFATVDVALSVLGLGKGTVRKLQESDPPTLCATPPGFVTDDGVTWGWLTADLIDRVEADDFAVTVAPGTLSGTGSWVSIERDDIELGDPDVPPVAQATIDIIDSSWEDGSTVVWMTLPADESPVVSTVALEQKVYHAGDDGLVDVYDADMIYVDGDSITVEAVSNLSLSSVLGPVWEGWRWLRGRSVGSPGCSPAAPPRSFHLGELLSNAPGGIIGECTYANPSQPGAIGAIDRVRAELTVDYVPVDAVQIDGPGFGEDFMSSVVAKAWSQVAGTRTGSFGSNTNLYVPPPPASDSYWSGDTFIVPQNVGQYRIDPNIGATGLGILGDKTFGLIVDKVAEYIRARIPASAHAALETIVNLSTEEMIECGMNLYRHQVPTDASGIYNFFRTCLRPNFDKIVVRITTELDSVLGLDDATRSKNTLLRLGFNFKMGDITNLAVDVLSSKQFEVLSQIASTLADVKRLHASDRNVWIGTEPPRPTALPDGTSIPANCVVDNGDGGWKVRRSCTTPPPVIGGGGGGWPTGPGGGPDGTLPIGTPDANVLASIGDSSNTIYLVNDLVAYGVPYADQSLKDCMLDRYPIIHFTSPTGRDRVIGTEDDLWNQETVYEEGCRSGLPHHVLPADATNWILRETTGTAWFIDANSELRWIRDRETYVCLAQDHYVLDRTPWAEISQFEADVYPGHATCP